MYLAQPLCLPVNVNPGMLFPLQNIKSNNDIALLAARVVANVAQFKDKLDRKALPVERATSGKKANRCAWPSSTAC
ncbi:choline O-acetyltransferase-like [Nilaparvata lugens]|uniref:choline O-acetyltransferase-like n=1 Tax=Nilaparvata lugens TaxID=108931 RepID=UPI00193DE19A|nr:choline O-acetyltransferase-like [Nilaparvata lugens]